MMVKIVILFLLVLAGISMIGNFLKPGGWLGRTREPPKVVERSKCGHCGRTVIGTTPCICGKG